ncbi:hypothetical protein ACRAWF_26115 [Streptomyces sp. L7]
MALVPAATQASAATQVCVLACDTLDPSQAKQETFPVPDKTLNGRRVQLHVSDADDMAWASIDNGSTGDAVWLDRSWDGGATWDGLLGKASIPSTWTGTRTLMYNITDPRNHKPRPGQGLRRRGRRGLHELGLPHRLRHPLRRHERGPGGGRRPAGALNHPLRPHDPAARGPEELHGLGEHRHGRRR